jgi:hypothetical protein
MTDTLLPITIDGDNSNHYRLERDYDLERALDRAGAINIKLDGDGQFQIFCIDRRFRDGEPGTINLNLSGLFDVVQACRSAWEGALEKLTTMRRTYEEWTKIGELIKGIAANPFDQQVIYFLCHAEAAGTTAAPSLVPPTLQLADGEIDAVGVRRNIRNRFEPSPPLIFINACRGGHTRHTRAAKLHFRGRIPWARRRMRRRTADRSAGSVRRRIRQSLLHGIHAAQEATAAGRLDSTRSHTRDVETQQSVRLGLQPVCRS